MNWFKVALWFVRTFNLEMEELVQWCVVLDVSLHFVGSASSGLSAFALMRSGLSGLFSKVSGPRGTTTLDELGIYLFSLSTGCFVSLLAHCAQDYGWAGLWNRLSDILG